MIGWKDRILANAHWIYSLSVSCCRLCSARPIAVKCQAVWSVCCMSPTDPGVSVYDINDSHSCCADRCAETRGLQGDLCERAAVSCTSPLTRRTNWCAWTWRRKILWRRHCSDGYADSPAITPDGKTLYLRCGMATAGGSSTRPREIRRRRYRQPWEGMLRTIIPSWAWDRITRG